MEPVVLKHGILFRIPVNDFQNKIGNIPDFKSIRFIRMFLTDFEDTVVLSFWKTGTGKKSMAQIQF